MRRCRAMSIGLTVVSFAVAVGADEPTKTYIETIPGSAVRFEMIEIPGGTFLTGSFLLEDGPADDERPRPRVVIRHFWMGKTEVTWKGCDPWFARSPNESGRPTRHGWAHSSFPNADGNRRLASTAQIAA
jgi:formylglycine-generating enzyme required for sulfatase activity